MAISDLLHDAIDAREELADRAKEIANRVMRERLAEALDATETFDEALMLLVKWISAELDALTTEAVREGARHGMRRRRKVKSTGAK